LTDLVLEGRSLADLTSTLAQLLGKPCAIFRPDGERAAAALPEAAPASAVPRLLEPSIAGLPEGRKALAEHESSPAVAAAPAPAAGGGRGGGRALVAGRVPAGGVLHRHVVAPILLGEELWGRLVVMEHKSRFTGGDVVAVRRAATLISLQVSSERKAAEADWN